MLILYLKVDDQNKLSSFCLASGEDSLACDEETISSLPSTYSEFKQEYSNKTAEVTLGAAMIIGSCITGSLVVAASNEFSFNPSEDREFSIFGGAFRGWSVPAAITMTGATLYEVLAGPAIANAFIGNAMLSSALAIPGALCGAATEYIFYSKYKKSRDN